MPNASPDAQHRANGVWFQGQTTLCQDAAIGLAPGQQEPDGCLRLFCDGDGGGVKIQCAEGTPCFGGHGRCSVDGACL